MKSPSKEIIALNIRRLRKLRRWTQHDLAEASGWNISTIQRIEEGKRSINIEQLQDIAMALGVSPQDLQASSRGLGPLTLSKEEQIRTELLLLVSSLSASDLPRALSLLKRSFPRK